jgi:hypothetical protein
MDYDVVIYYYYLLKHSAFCIAIRSVICTN